MIKLTIDGKKVTADAEATILEVAREEGIEIPTLCYHEALTPIGACRLCVVEVTEGGRTRTMAACVAPVSEGMEVVTNSEKIQNIRRTIVQLLLARCPELEVIKELADKLGVKDTPFKPESEDCFLCGICVRACDEIVGVNAIGFTNRGVRNEVLPPFAEASNVCIGCGTCTTVCPARTFDLERVTKSESMHTFAKEYRRDYCSICGTHYMIPESYLSE
ncbi:MAG: 2Fe-2S iron-sulfur cluster binding domain-containing protein [Candidatus Zixiibacteriota bacterium]|nr:MAG: 2Fe-2S iron-sulfur cluster binding domain-containing protein [candidate division Zixibacteria bacterium]